jgi:hypothetical protein
MAKPRKKIPYRTKLAATLCQMLRPNENGELVPIIDYESSKQLTESQILSLFQFDHYPTPVNQGGKDEHHNLVPRPILEHREKTAKVDIPAAAKADRLSATQEEFRRRMLAKAGQGWATPEPQQKKSAPMPGSRASKWKKKISGETVRR